jgi:VanZ family protein
MRFFIAFLWLIIVTILLTLPGSAFPKENWFDKIWLDKWIHIFLFAGLVFLWARAVGKNYPMIAILALLYGIGMEFVQLYFVRNRSFDKGDIAGDGIGALLGWLFVWYRYKKNKPL